MRRHYKGISINTSKNTHETVFELIKESTQKKVVDIPSGSGAFVLRLKDAGFTDVVAVDIENILEIEHEQFIQGDMTKTFPFGDEAIDIFICIDGIEHISQQYDFIAEAHRILKRDGVIIISTPNISSLRSRWKWFWTGHHHKCNSPLDEKNPSPLHHIGMISYHELRYLLHTSGFEIDKVTTNRTKAINWIYAIFTPMVYLSTWWVYLKRGKKEGTRDINDSVRKAMFSKAILFGETLIVKAVKR